MRKIKFRGYAVEEMVNGQWLFGFGAKDMDYVDGTIEWHLHTLNGVYEVFSESIGQYTGLKDKNGKEIYEGDILKIHVDHRVLRQSVYFDERGFYSTDEFALFELNDFEHVTDFKVIGNIYEHSHLLEGEK